MKTEFAHEILRSCEKLNHMGNSQKKRFLYFCIYFVYVPKQNTQQQLRSFPATMKDL